MGPSEVRVVIDGYRDLVRVGSGGFSMVYRAHQDAFDRTVAVKVLTVELVDETAQRRFQRECRASGRLSNHPNIVTVLDSGFTEDGRPFITTEFMSNGSLADRLDELGPYRVEDALDVGVKMCGALAAVHAAGILHRDIKPQNILVSDYGEPALADFGISAITIGPDASIGTSSITPLHVAPEVLEGQPTSQASDVYALGSTIYTLLANRAPFQKDDEDALLPLMRRVVMDPVPPIERDDLPAPVFDLLRYSMEKQPFARYGTAVSFGEAIQALQAHLGWAVTPLRKPGPTTAEIVTSREPPLDVTPPSNAAPSNAAPSNAAPSNAAPSNAPRATVASATEPSTVAGARHAEPPGAVPPAKRTSAAPIAVGAAAVLVVVALVALALVTRSSSSPDAGAGSSGSTQVASDGGVQQPSDGVTDTTEPSVIDLSDPASGLRFDIDSYNVDATPPTPGGVLRVGIDTEPASFNPAVSRFTLGAALVADTVFEPLTVIYADGPHPYLATSVTPNESFDQWTISIPEGVTFHDGSAFNAEAVKANLDARLAESLMAPLLEPVSGVRVEGSTVVVKTRSPWPAFPVALAGQAGLMASPATLANPEADQPIGTGPFAFGSWDRGQKVVVTKNTAYRVPDRPVLDEIHFSIVRDTDERTTSLKSGTFDLIFTTDPVAIDDLINQHVIFQARYAMVASIVFKTTDPALADVRLRKALAAAIDRDQIVDAVFEGHVAVASSPFPPWSPWYVGKADQASNLDHAKELITDFLKGKESTTIQVTLLIGTSERQQQLAQMVQQRWQEIGVETTIDVAPDGDTVTPIVEGTYQAALWTYDVPTDPDELYRWFHTDPAGGEYTYNLTRLANPSIDKAFEKGRSASAESDRKTAYGVVEQGLIEQAPAAWMVYLPAALAGSMTLSGWDLTTVGGVGRGGAPWANTLGFK